MPSIQAEAEDALTEEKKGDGKEKCQVQEEIQRQQPTTSDMLKILDLLDKRADTIGARLEQIEVRMGELQREDREGKKVWRAPLQRGLNADPVWVSG